MKWISFVLASAIFLGACSGERGAAERSPGAPPPIREGSVKPVLLASIEGQPRHPRSGPDGGPAINGETASPSPCCAGSTYGREQWASAYLLVVFHRWAMEAEEGTPADAVAKVLGPESELEIISTDDAALACSTTEWAYADDGDWGGACWWANDWFFGVLNFSDDLDVETMRGITDQVQAEVLELNR